MIGCQLSTDLLDVTPTTGRLPTPTEAEIALPDLAIGWVKVETENGRPCVSLTNQLGVRVQVVNQGELPSGSFTVEINGAWQEVANLEVEETVLLWFRGYETENEIWLDVNQQVTEQKEDNNHTWLRMSSESTLAAECLPTPTPDLIEINAPVEMTGHAGSVWDVKFSPAGNLIASVSVDNTLRLWRAAEGALLRTMQGHPFAIRSLAFAPDGAFLTTGSYDGVARIWRVSNARLEQELHGHAGWVLDVAYSPDGLLLATCAEDFTVRLWRTRDGELQETVDQGMGQVNSLEFAPDGAGLAWAENGGTVRVWEPGRRGFRWSAQIEGVDALSLVYGPDGEWIAVGYSDGAIRFWRAADGQLLHTLSGHQAPVTALAVSAAGNLASAAQDQTLLLWTVASSGRSATP
ncbi:MAG TPA: WD40 repeat domain-containing protein, partial [Anaerolineales bacterium]|nr:WD40 repeat domain-containing protein [Anaerolineales bacterium]